MFYPTVKRIVEGFMAINKHAIALHSDLKYLCQLGDLPHHIEKALLDRVGRYVNEFTQSDVVNAQLSDEDKACIAYFALEYGDITRWPGWKKKQGLIEREYPEILAAILDI